MKAERPVLPPPRAAADDRTSDKAPLDLLQDQWKHSIETFRFVLGALVQCFGFLAAADAALLAFGLKEKLPEVIGIAATMPLIMIAALAIASAATVPIVVTAIRTEAAMPPLPAPFVSTFASRTNRRVLDYVRRTSPESEDLGDRHVSPRWAFRGRKVVLILLAGSLAQAGLAISQHLAR